MKEITAQISCMLEVISYRWARDKANHWTRDEAHSEMGTAYEEERLSIDWIQGSYAAIMNGKELFFSFDTKERTWGYLAGTKEQLADLAKVHPKRFKVQFDAAFGKAEP